MTAWPGGEDEAGQARVGTCHEKQKVEESGAKKQREISVIELLTMLPFKSKTDILDPNPPLPYQAVTLPKDDQSRTRQFTAYRPTSLNIKSSL